MLLQSVLSSGIAAGAFYALLAMALQMTYSGSGILNFAQGDIAAFGAFAYWQFTVKNHVDGLIALVLALVLGLVVGAVVYLLLRPFSSRSAFEASMASIAVSFLLEGVFQYHFGSQTLLPAPLVRGGPLHLGGAVVPRQDIVIIVVAALAGAAVFVLLRLTRLGLAIRAVANNPEAARIAGVRVGLVQGSVFAIGGLLSFAGGAVTAPIVGAGFVSGQTFIVSAFVAAVLGGLGAVWMAALGGLALGIIESIIGSTSISNYTDAALFVVLILVLLFRPGGLAGKAQAT